MPLPPSTDELFQNYGTKIGLYKSISDEVIYHPVEYKPLFGTHAQDNLQATIKIVKNGGEVVNNNQLKTNVINAVNRFFSLQNWDFGETFYFSELSAFIHQELGKAIASVVIVPNKSESMFGDLYQVRAASDELFFSTATVDNVEVVKSLSATNLKQIKGNAISTSSTASSTSSGSSGSSGSGGSGY